MIPENLLFQNAPIFFISDRSFWWILPCLFIALFWTWVYRYFVLRKNKNPIIQKTEIYVFPQKEAADFELKMAEILRKKIQKKYTPHMSLAHTSKEMAEYVREKKILDVFQILETAEYGSEKIPLEKRNELISEVEEF